MSDTSDATFDPQYPSIEWGDSERGAIAVAVLGVVALTIDGFLTNYTYNDGTTHNAHHLGNLGDVITFVGLLVGALVGLGLVAVCVKKTLQWRSYQIRDHLTDVRVTQYPLEVESNVAIAIKALTRGSVEITVADADDQAPTVNFSAAVVACDDSGQKYIGTGPSIRFAGTGVENAVRNYGLVPWLEELRRRD